MEDKLLLTRIYPTVEKNLSLKSNQEKIKKRMDEYLNKNSKFLTEIAPMHQVIFSDDFKETIITSCGVLKLYAIKIRDRTTCNRGVEKRGG